MEIVRRLLRPELSGVVPVEVVCSGFPKGRRRNEILIFGDPSAIRDLQESVFRKR